MLNLLSAKKVLVISPHPDDIEIGIGMLIKKMAENGVEVYELLLSRGELAGDSNIREQEARESAGFLGIKEVFVNSFANTLFDKYRNEIKNRIEEVVKAICPDMIFTPWMIDNHIDHIVTSTETEVAGRSVSNLIYYQCMKSSKFEPNLCFYGNTKLMSDKLYAISLHKSQITSGRINIAFTQCSGKYWLYKFLHHQAVARLAKEKECQVDDLYAEPLIVGRMSV
ncbi:PIG-L family deacetylase [Candidatus Dojkabacteria bacterium]|jgi:LmbE family N-acetylglucosaminyl deacetylase|nr:PIG-L family deacetylase [Candidatus Dojkabacteria bacterium]